MAYSLIKLLALLLIACVLGISVGWLLRGRREREQAPVAAWKGGADVLQLTSELAAMRQRCQRVEAELAALRAQPTPGATSAVAARQEAPATAQAPPDDLKRISGVGPGLERTLNELGVTRFAQIACWSDADVERLDERLRFPGRIRRDDWIGQARTLMGDC